MGQKGSPAGRALVLHATATSSKNRRRKKRKERREGERKGGREELYTRNIIELWLRKKKM